jgi:hypothetical protein
MNGNNLGDEIALAIIDSRAPPEVQAQVKAIWEKIGTAIVNHIKTNAEITTTVTTKVEGAAAGVTPGPGSAVVSGMGKGSGTGKVT